MITLRPMQAGDREMLLHWRNQSEVARYMYNENRIGPEEHRRWFESALQDSTRKYWVIVCDDEDVGLANIYNIDERHRRCYWAFYLASSNIRGKGVGSFVEYFVLRHVFDELGLNRLCCEVLCFNEAVVHMHKKFGFTEEGVLRQHIIKDGQPFDVVTLGILREEWSAARTAMEEQLRSKNLL
jgi:UDP-4-amino-4,6-dideoxy-N-acetyl-beta-L-altrosamine N-acetyltransferase